ncbi:PPOX class F420-dependent oxidoreductase, partial [Streptomyces sp. NPDC006326]|uniref:PPOX class F420-dependent oxidoreductase n=1 Tax=Streptomyces sp. NPDC006326 TaxID=3156752 RepID=UPI0033A4DE56
MTRFEGFSEAELAYLRSQRLGRLATVDAHGQPQANPVGFFPQPDGTVLVGGAAMGTTKKWRNLQANPRLALVVDDLVSTRPWRVRGIEIRVLTPEESTWLWVDTAAAIADHGEADLLARHL